MSAVSIRKLGVKFGQLKVLENLDLDVNEGEFIVLLGPSGCGKSTLLNAVAGLLDVNAGQVWIGGRNVTWEEPKDRGIGMVFQSYALYPRMTAEGNMSFGLRMQRLPRNDHQGIWSMLPAAFRPKHRLPRSEIRDRVARAAALLQIQPLLNRRPSELSGGQRQRVAIGRALVRDADVFLFDEPLSNLDAKLRTELRVELKKLHMQLGSTMIYVTHDQIEALTLADRVAIMYAGVIQQLATPKEIYQRPINRFVAGFVGSPAMNFVTGKLALNGGDSAALVCADGLRISLKGYRFGEKPEDGRPAVVGLRPEQIHLTKMFGDAVGVPLTLALIEPMGADSLLWGSIAGESVSLRTGPDESHAIGEKVEAFFQPSRASLFDAETGMRL